MTPIPLRAWAALLAVSACLLPSAAGAATSAIEAQSQALERARRAVLGVQALAVDGARSAATLGQQRQGSGVLISADGLVLTIGYLVLEAEQVDLVTEDAQRIPARVVGYDVATGFGLLQALAPLAQAPAPLGESAALRDGEPLVVASGGETAEVGMAQLVARRPFSGFWEYHLDSALFTAPPRADHGGAALFNLRGELLGIGSLVVADADGPAEDGTLPGNMFVPVDALKPILREVREHGRSRASARAWLGLNCVDIAGQIRIVRISDDSPADVAGLQAGDRIVGIDGMPVATLEQLWKRLWAGASPERSVALEIERDGERQALTLQSVDREKTLRRARGI